MGWVKDYIPEEEMKTLSRNYHIIPEPRYMSYGLTLNIVRMMMIIITKRVRSFMERKLLR